MSKKLVEAGWTKPTEFVWANLETYDGYTTGLALWRDKDIDRCKYKTVPLVKFPAPLATEILEELPKIVEDNIDGDLIQFEFHLIRPIDCRAPSFYVFYMSPHAGKDVLAECSEDSLSNALAQMYCYLKKENLI
jgi:hypothetical protein